MASDDERRATSDERRTRPPSTHVPLPFSFSFSPSTISPFSQASAGGEALHVPRGDAVQVGVWSSLRRRESLNRHRRRCLDGHQRRCLSLPFVSSSSSLAGKLTLFPSPNDINHDAHRISIFSRTVLRPSAAARAQPLSSSSSSASSSSTAAAAAAAVDVSRFVSRFLSLFLHSHFSGMG